MQFLKMLWMEKCTCGKLLKNEENWQGNTAAVFTMKTKSSPKTK
jgi:hypothetical protein